MMILRARDVLPMSLPPIEDGAVAVEGENVVAVGKADDVLRQFSGETRDLGEVVLAPGLINAHCHLDYSGLKGQVHYHGSFLDWILHLVSLKRNITEDEYFAAVSDGMEQLARTGTTTVVNVEAVLPLIDRFTAPKLRVFWCLELINFNRREPAEQLIDEALRFIDARKDTGAHFGLSPHAPYTAGANLYQLAARAARIRKLPLTTHLAESVEEDDMFRRGTGRMYDHFLRAGRDMSDCKHVGVIQYMADLNVLSSGCLVVHANCLTPPDVKILQRTGVSVVHCPKSHRFFQREMPLLTSMWEQGINVCLGTDSLASNDSLNMFAEMQTLVREFPDLPAEKVLAMATTCPAYALNLPEKLGLIATNAYADMIAVRRENSMDSPCEAVVYAEKPPVFSMVGGKVIVDAQKS